MTSALSKIVFLGMTLLRLDGISSYAISTDAISTDCIFNFPQFRAKLILAIES